MQPCRQVTLLPRVSENMLRCSTCPSARFCVDRAREVVGNFNGNFEKLERRVIDKALFVERC